MAVTIDTRQNVFEMLDNSGAAISEAVALSR